jgi:hypothetical protein
VRPSSVRTTACNTFGLVSGQPHNANAGTPNAESPCECQNLLLHSLLTRQAQLDVSGDATHHKGSVDAPLDALPRHASSAVPDCVYVAMPCQVMTTSLRTSCTLPAKVDARVLHDDVKALLEVVLVQIDQLDPGLPRAVPLQVMHANTGGE